MDKHFWSRTHFLFLGLCGSVSQQHCQISNGLGIVVYKKAMDYRRHNSERRGTSNNIFMPLAEKEFICRQAAFFAFIGEDACIQYHAFHTAKGLMHTYVRSHTTRDTNDYRNLSRDGTRVDWSRLQSFRRKHGGSQKEAPCILRGCWGPRPYEESKRMFFDPPSPTLQTISAASVKQASSVGASHRVR